MTILDLLQLSKTDKSTGIWLSGIQGEGEYKRWWGKGHLYEHSNWKDWKEEGDFKRWASMGVLYKHFLFKDGKTIKDYLDV